MDGLPKDVMTDVVRLQEENERLHAEIVRLQKLLAFTGIDYALPRTSEAPRESEGRTLSLGPTDTGSLFSPVVSKKSPLEEKSALFLSSFHGRDDVYARQWQSKEGKIGYSPACKHEWQRGVCGKPKQKCAGCPNAE